MLAGININIINNTAKVLVNAKFDKTGVVQLLTTVKIEMLSTAAAGNHVVGFDILVRMSKQQFCKLHLGTTAQLQINNLRDQLNAYTGTTGIRCTLSADRSNIIMVQDEGEDIAIQNLNFASVGNAITTKMICTAMNMDQDVEGTAKNVLDEDHNSGNSDSIRFAGQLKFHSSQTFTIVGNAGGGLYDASPGAATLNKVSTIDLRTLTGAVTHLKG